MVKHLFNVLIKGHAILSNHAPAYGSEIESGWRIFETLEMKPNVPLSWVNHSFRQLKLK